MRQLIVATMLFWSAANATGATLKCRLVAVFEDQVCAACVDGVLARRAESRALDTIGRRGAIGAVVKLRVAGDVITDATVPFRNRITRSVQVDRDRAECEWIADPPTALEPIIRIQPSSGDCFEHLVESGEIEIPADVEIPADRGILSMAALWGRFRPVINRCIAGAMGSRREGQDPGPACVDVALILGSIGTSPGGPDHHGEGAEARLREACGLGGGS